MKTTTTTGSTVCPLCHRAVVTIERKDGCHVLPTHGHNAVRKMVTRAPKQKCRASGFSVEGLAIVASWTSAFGLLNR